VFSLAPALFGLVMSLNAFVIGFLSDRIDVKRLIPVGAVVAAAGLSLCYFIRELWQMIFYFGILCALGGSALSMLPHTIIISNWFVRLRGTAIGISSSGTGLGTLAFVPLLQLVISAWGWRNGFLALALVAGPLLVPLILVFQKSHPSQVEQRSVSSDATRSTEENAGFETKSAAAAPIEASALPGDEVLAVLLRSRRFWFCLAQFILGPLSTMPIIIHQAALLQGRGLSEMGSALIVGVYGLSVFCGMIAGGSVSDRMGREWTYTLGTISIIAGSVFLLAVPSGSRLTVPLLYAVFFGLGFGTRPSMDSATAADIFKGRHFGLIYGILQLGLGVGLFCGPVLGGLIYDMRGSYTAAVVFCMAAVLAATACIWAAEPRRGGERELV